MDVRHGKNSAKGSGYGRYCWYLKASSPNTEDHDSNEDDTAIGISSAPTFVFDDNNKDEFQQLLPSDDFIVVLDDEESNGSQHSSSKPKKKKKKKLAVSRK